MIEIDHLEYVHATGVPALRGVHVTLQSGRWTALIGPNGSGKTTLARCLNGLLVPTAGSVRVGGSKNAALPIMAASILCDGETVLIPGVLEHIERAGVHSGDSLAIYPGLNLTEEEVQTLVDYTVRIGRTLGMKGLMNQLLRTSLGGGTGSDSLRLRGRSITVEADRPEPLEIDGDHVGWGSLEARVLPGALDVLVPPEASVD